VVGIKEPSSNGEIRIFPNPASSYFEVSFVQSAVGGQESAVGGQRSAVGGQEFNIVLSNLLGEKIKEMQVQEKESWKIKIDVSGCQPGIYFVTVCDNSMPVLTRQLVIIR
jgi:hypothetical protein